MVFCIAILFAFGLAVSGFVDEKRLSIYTGATSYSITVEERAGTDYVGLLELLQPLGSVTARTDGRFWKLSFNRVDGEFTPGATRSSSAGAGF